MKSPERGEALVSEVSTVLPMNGSTPRPTILVVEDDLGFVALLHDVLNSWGYEMVSAFNGQEGLQVLTALDVDGVLLDIHMPVMGGVTMLDEMRWLGYLTPVVVMSGGVNGAILRQLVDEGAQAFMTKPFSLLELRELCARVFEQHGVGVAI